MKKQDELRASEQNLAPGRSKASKSKRKAESTEPIDEVVANKKAKLGDVASEEDSESEDEEEEEEWQREAANQLAAEAEEERKRAEERKKAEEEEAQRAQELASSQPPRIELSVEEGKALFKVLNAYSKYIHGSSRLDSGIFFT